MTFIPAKTLRIGQRVRSVRLLKIPMGHFTVGHKFTIIRIGVRGYDLIDDDGNVCLETPFGLVVDDGGE